ncbi:MAG TPA: hypothetical protein VFG50_06090 [Rhodothermales bacterium]|nr:hypothetical protein [Rhodothermales bacterium]
MEELVGLVAQKTGLPQDKARIAVETVLNYVKGKLPPAMSGQIDSVVSGSSPGGLGDMAKGIGGMFGGGG